MEGDFGAQVVPPVFIHQTLPGRFCESPAPLMAKKRELPWQNHSFQHQQRPQQSIMSNSGLQNPENNWNPKFWDWDSAMFKAKPLPEAVDLSPEPMLEHKKKGDKAVRPLKKVTVGGEEENLTLNLGGRSYLAEEAATRPSKKVRSGSPGGGAYPMCQVDDCMKDLSSAKDYHRRHKVCEVHSKTTTALVAKQMQRFCQQCSRFHPLSEFDEGKRSCRRRLAGHNRRRRKTQPDDVSSRLFLPLNRENNGVTEGGNLDVVNLLTIIARLQENGADKIANGSSIPDGESLIQILSKINSFPVSADSAVRSSVLGRSDLNLLHNLETLSEPPFKINGNQSAPSTRDLLAVLSAAVAAASPQALAFISNGCRDGNGGDRRNMNSLEKDNGCSLQKKPSSCFSSGGTERNSGLFPSPFPSPSEFSECQAQEARSCLPLQLFGSSPENDSPPKLPSSRRYFSSDSSNPIEERSPSSSPPVVRKLFPLDSVRQERMTSYREDAVPVEVSSNGGWASRLELFKGSNSRAENSAVSNPLYQAGYTSSSSDHSPSSSNFDIQDRTGRIIFKLFDKDPSNFPGTLRTQILDWLSHSPSEMESYIRPGCVILSVYMSMSSMAWDSLQEDFLQHVTSLIKDSNIDFWRSGRFLVQMDRKLASHKDGKIHLCKNWKTWSAPELLSVAPLAVVGGQETTLVLRGRNLTAPGTKIHCTYMGGYTSKEVSSHTYPRTIYEDSKLETFLFSGGVPNVLGRCFIEVENGFKGNSFPLIVADVSICQELRILESELEVYARKEDLVEDQYFERPRSREDALQFLNELGWLFQRKCASKTLTLMNFSLSRFKFLFAFSVERDWSALVKVLLDVFIEWNSDGDGLSKASVETLSEVHLLNRAVKRKCKKMIDLLLHYSVSCSSVASRKYLFLPNLAGPGGLTPLHLAACMQDSEEMVDALTNDPQEIGLNCWISLLDANMQSPQMYASIRSHHSYNKLVNGKLADRRNRQFSITVSDAEISLDPSWLIAEREKPTPNPLQVRSCAQCAVSLTRSSNRIYRSPGLLNRPYVHSMLAIAAVCVCVCLFLRGEPDLGSVAPFEWENVLYGSS